MTYQIIQSPLTLQLKSHIYEAFGKHSIYCTGIDGLAEEPVVFELRQGDTLVGCIVVQLFWGRLHIKYLLVEEPYRGKGFARRLMEHAFDFARKQNCDFIFVETMSFQAPKFYQKLGFKADFVRHGYNKGVSFYYLSKDLGESKQPEVTIRPLTKTDIPIIVTRFAKHNWPKPSSTFEKYLQEQDTSERLIWVAYVKDEFVGYITLKWQSRYQPFRLNKIPEIMDLNVLPPFRNFGIGSKLLEIAETAASAQSNVVGIGVGLYDGYGEAQKIYIKRGYIPDGRGITYSYQSIVPGSTVTLDDDLVLWFTKKI
jgi:GNAT superfamily N-acetyltransferase